MKTCLLLLATLLSFGAYSQNPYERLQLSLLPANPTEQDVVKIICASEYSSTGCALDSSSVRRSGPRIDVYARHRVGLAAAICYSTDTTVLGTFASGTYKLHYGNHAHTDTADYTGNPNGNDSLQFTVRSSSSSVGSEALSGPLVLVPNPASDRCSVRADLHAGDELIVHDLTGRECCRQTVAQASQETSIAVHALPAGNYLLTVRHNGMAAGRVRFSKW